MDNVNKTLFIPLYGKAQVSKKGIILNDTKAEDIWAEESFPIKGKSKSKWLAYNMAMRARVFDDWTEQMLNNEHGCVVLHIGCGLDSRCLRVNGDYEKWLDCDFPGVIEARKKYYTQSDKYSTVCLDAQNTEDINALPDAHCAVVVLEGVSMYLSNESLRCLFVTLANKYERLCVMLDVYTEFSAKASKYKNPVNDVGVTQLYGVDDIEQLLNGTGLRMIKEHSFTPEYLVNELTGFEKSFFKMMFTGKMYKKMYRLFELSK